jgi:hypothetical protein
MCVFLVQKHLSTGCTAFLMKFWVVALIVSRAILIPTAHLFAKVSLLTNKFFFAIIDDLIDFFLNKLSMISSCSTFMDAICLV